MNDKLKVNEIFYSIDGEGRRAGYPSVFIRLSGCNLRCNYCDSEYSFYEGKEMTIDEVIDEVKKYDCRNITLTGGEPLCQDVYELLFRLHTGGYETIIETNGSKDILNVQRYAKICMDWKTDSSGMALAMMESNLLMLRPSDLLKIVARASDLPKIRVFLDKWELRCPIYLSPVYGEISLSKLAEFVKNYKGKNKVAMQLQIHKIIWNPDERGV